MQFRCAATYALAAILFTARAAPQTAAATSAETTGNSDSYQIYSMLILKELERWPLQQYAIRQETVTKGWYVPAAPGKRPEVRDCIEIPPETAQEYEAAIADFQQKNSWSEPLESRFKLDKPYLLLDEVDTTAFRSKLFAAFGFAPKDYRPDHRFRWRQRPHLAVTYRFQQ